MDLGAGPARGLESQPDLRALYGVNRAERVGQESVEAFDPIVRRSPDLPGTPGPPPRRPRPACRRRPSPGRWPRSSPPRRARPHTAPRWPRRGAGSLFPRDLERPDSHTADLGHVAQDRDTELGQEPLAHSGHRHAGRGLTARWSAPGRFGCRGDHTSSRRRGRRGPDAGGSRSWARRPARRWRADRHGLLPVLPIAIANGQRDRTAEGLAPPNAGGDVDLILLDLHPTTTPVAALAPGEVAIDIGFGEPQARREPRR